MGLRENFSTLGAAFRAGGLPEMLRTAVRGVAYDGATRMILVALTQPRVLPDAAEAAKTHTLRFATVEDLTPLLEDKSADISPMDIERLRRGTARCMLQLDGPRLVGYSWVWNTRPAQIDDAIYLHLPKHTQYIFKGYTNPAYRGYAFQALRHLKSLELLRTEGVQHLFGFVDQYNFKSLHGVRKSGFVPVGSVVIRRRRGRVRMTIDVDQHFWSDDPAI
jgi:hypothetical protein